MNRSVCILCFVVTSLSAVFGQQAIDPPHESPRTRSNFNEGWSFARFGRMPGGERNAEPAGIPSNCFDDSAWRRLDLPHDWAIEGPFDMELPGSTGKLPWKGLGWYRKTFTLPEGDRGRRIFLDID